MVKTKMDGHWNKNGKIVGTNIYLNGIKNKNVRELLNLTATDEPNTTLP